MLTHSAPSKEEQAEQLLRSYQLSSAFGRERVRQRTQEMLCQMFEGNIYRFAKTIPSARALDPEDVRQECRLAILETLDRWNPEVCMFNVACCQTVRKRVSDLARRERLIYVPRNAKLNPEERMATIRPLCDLTEIEEYGRGGSMSADMETTYEGVILKVDVGRALERLSKQDRQLLFLYFGLDGEEPRGCSEICQSWGVSRWAVQRAVNASLTAVRPGLEGYQ